MTQTNYVDILNVDTTFGDTNKIPFISGNTPIFPEDYSGGETMPEINPITIDQIFLKKIAENTGSEYNTGDVSEINPISIDQILLKEIAANTAGQSGEITELEDKVTANTSAIDAITDLYSAKNMFHVPDREHHGITFTDNGVNGYHVSGTSDGARAITDTGAFLPYGTYKFSGYEGKTTKIKYIATEGSSTWLDVPSDGIVNNSIYAIALWVDAGVSNLDETIYPMLQDARVKSTVWKPWSMTNEELTEAQKSVKHKGIFIDTAYGTAKMPINIDAIDGPNGYMLQVGEGDGFSGTSPTSQLGGGNTYLLIGMSSTNSTNGLFYGTQIAFSFSGNKIAMRRCGYSSQGTGTWGAWAVVATS